MTAAHRALARRAAAGERPAERPAELGAVAVLETWLSGTENERPGVTAAHRALARPAADRPTED